MTNAQLARQIQRHYPQIYLACHVDHVTARSTRWRLSSRDSSILSHLDADRPTSPRDLATHLGVRPSTLSATIARLERLGYISSRAKTTDRRERELRLTRTGEDAMVATSVLDEAKLTSLLERMTPEDRAAGVRGLELLARAAQEICE